VAQVQDIGTYQMLTAQVGDHTIKARVAPEVALPAVGDSIWLQVLGEHTCFYQNEELLA
jgi:glycerol transport system ATP-binding protein